jgi:hypothetical protein
MVWLGTKFGHRLAGLDEKTRLRKLEDMTSQFLQLCDKDQFPHLKQARLFLKRNWI